MDHARLTRRPFEPLTVGIASEQADGVIAEIGAALAAATRDLGLATQPVSTSADESEVDIVIAVGWPPLYPDLLRRSRTSRRIVWFFEPLPGPVNGPAERIHSIAPTGWLLDRLIALAPRLTRSRRLRGARESAERVREQRRNARTMGATADAFDRIVVDTPQRAAGVMRLGMPEPAITPIGYHESVAGALSDARSERDIGVLFMGRLGNPLSRRRRILAEVARGLDAAGVNVVLQVDHIDSAQRRLLLERTRVVLDIHRLVGTHETYRFVLASAAGAAVVSEPAGGRAPVVAGIHLVEAVPGAMAQTIIDLLADEPRRQRLVAASRRLMRDELSMGRSLARLLDTAP